jgi:hypothetical protein
VSKQEDTNIKVTADVDPAKASLREIEDLVSSTQQKINRVFSTVQDNNGQISNKQLAGVQNGFGRLDEVKSALDNALNQAKATQSGPKLEESLNTLAPKLDLVVNSLRELRSGNNSTKLDSIFNARTTTSRAFRDESATIRGERGDFSQQNLHYESLARESRSDIHNLASSLKREMGNLDVGRKSGYISYNRYQQYKASSESIQERLHDQRDRFNSPTGDIARFASYYHNLQSQAEEANSVASAPGATTEQVRYARALDEQVKHLEKVNDRFKKQEEELRTAEKNLESFNNRLNDTQGVTIGDDPNSFMGQLNKRKYTILRGALSAGGASIGSAYAQGNSLRLSSFDDIKSTAYANGGRDGEVLNTLGDYGYRYGYNGAEMGQFANAYTSTTGNVGSVRDVAGVAQTWARQSRITGANTQSTLGLEQTVGNSANLNSSQMSSVGNAITNSIINSGMSAKATEQQQGLSMLIQNASNQGLTARDEKNLAGFQGSIASGGAQFQGTQGAQNTMQLAQGLGNYNNPMMRQLFAQSNPSRYTGVEGSANMVFDMQNFQKQPWKMKGILQNAENSYGSRRIAASNLSLATGVPAETVEQWIKLADSGKLDKKHIDKLEKSSNASKKGGTADQNYDNTGASQLQKYNSALADSAMKASQALDGLRGIIAKAYKAGGGFSPLVSGFAGAIGAGAGNLMSIYALDKLRGRGGSGGAGGAGAGILDSIFKRGKSPVEKEAEKVTAKAGEQAVKTGAKSVSRSGIRATASGILKSSKLRGLVRGAKAGLPGVGDLVFGGLDLATSVATTKKGTKARRKAVGSSLGSSAGSVAGGVVGGLIGSIFPGAGTAVGAVAGSVAGGWLGDKFGGFLGGKVGKSKDKAINKAKGQSLRGARKTASKYNKSGGILRGIVKNGKRFLPGVALGVAGLGLMDDFFGGKAKASSKKNSEKSEAWRILRGYDKMLDHAMRVVQSAKSIKNGGDSSSKKDGDDSDISGTSGEGEKAIRSVAKAIGKKLGVDPKLVYAQLMHETGGGTHMAGKNNYGGIVYAGQKGAKAGSHQPDGSGNYADFDSLDDFANAYASTLQKMGINSSIKSVNDWANQLHSKGYFTTSPAEYAGGMDRFAKQYATGGIRQYASGSPLITDHPSTNNGSDVYGEAGTEAYVPLNAGHYFSGLSTLDDLAGIFGKKVVNPGVSESNGKSTTINPSYNINLTINGGTDDPDTLAQTVANKVREMLSQYDSQQAMSNQQTFFANETSGLLV